MAFDIGTADRNNALQIIGNPVTLTASQRTALRAEFTTDPAVRGYAGKTHKEALILFAMEYTIPNPSQQGRTPKTIPSPEMRELVRIIRAKALMTDAELRDLLTEPDPNYRAEIIQPARCASVLNGLIPELSEVAAARA